MSAPDRGPWTRVGLIALAVVVLAAYARLHAHPLFSVDFGGGLDNNFLYVSAGEARMWLAHTAMAIPISLGAAWLLHERGRALLERVRVAVGDLTPSQQRAALLVVFAMLMLTYSLARTLVLYDLPLTDDENAARFGGRVWASGALTVPPLQPAEAFSQKFLVQNASGITAADWPGVLAFAALSDLLGTDILYAMCAAVGGVVVVVLADQLVGRLWAVLAGALWLCSPMVFTLSATTHAHVVSRTLVALAALAYVRCLDDDPARASHRTRWAFALGLFVGLGFATRPFEVACLFAPIGVQWVWRALARRDGAVGQLVATLAGFIGPVLLFAAYDAAITGSPWVPPRFMGASANMDSLATMAWHERLGVHFGFNLTMLSVLFLGAVGLPLSVAGVRWAAPPLRILASGVALSLLLMLGHDNIGIHTVGPIHNSEAVVVLILLVCVAARRIDQWFQQHAATDHVGTWFVGVYVVVAVGLGFTLPYALQLTRHGRALDAVYTELARADVHDAIVLAPPTRYLAPGPGLGSWQLMMPSPDPLMRGDVNFALYGADPQALAAAHPGRNIYRLDVQPGRGIVGVALVHPAQSP